MNSIKKILCALSFIFAAPSLSAQIFTPATVIKNPLFIFDVGSVLVKISQFSNTTAYFNLFNKVTGKKGTLINVGLWCSYNFRTLSAMNNQGPEDNVIDYIAQNNPILNETLVHGKTLADEIKEIVSTATPVKKTQRIVKTLIQKGYPVALGSNKGKNTIARLIKSSALANLGYVTIFTCDSCPEAAQGVYYKKPAAVYYDKLIKDLHEKGYADHTPIFIDNNRDNVEAAAAAGIIAILYTTPEQLIKDLKQLGITL